MIAPKIPFVKNGQILTANLVNHIIARTEYASRLLREYRCVAGSDMFVEPHYDGTRVSIGTPVGGGADSYGGGAGSANKPITIGRLPTQILLSCAGMDLAETLSWNVSGSVESAFITPFAGLSETAAIMSGNTISLDPSVFPNIINERRFTLVVNGRNLNNFSATKGGAQAAGFVIEVTFINSRGQSFKFSDFCGVQDSVLGQVEATGSCSFYNGGNEPGGPPGIPFLGVGNYWLFSSGSTMLFRINSEPETEYSANEALSAFSSVVYTENRIYFDFSDLGARQIVFEENATQEPGVAADNFIRFFRTGRNTAFSDSVGTFVGDQYLSRRTVNASFLSAISDKRFYVEFPNIGGGGSPPRPPNNLRVYLL